MMMKTIVLALALSCATATTAPAAKAPSSSSGTLRGLNVLVFGDSQGDTGPTYQALQDAFDLHSVSANVVNAAVGGTLACGWLNDGGASAIADAARDAFGTRAAPDVVWYTAGGNDFAGDELYHLCLSRAADDDAAAACVAGANDRMIGCTQALFEGLWAEFPDAKVGQYNYMATNFDEDCQEENCLEASGDFLGSSYCLETYKDNGGAPSECMLRILEYWQSIYVDALQAQYPQPQYTGMNLLGAVQEASGVPGASVGHLNVTGGGAKCEWMISCVHPMYGTPAADAIRDAFWDLWLAPLFG